MNSAHITELLESLKEWADDFRDQRHPASLTLYRAICYIEGKWIKATDINRPGGWYWTRLGADDESCPCVVFVTMDNDGDSAPDFRVVWNGESERAAKRLSHYADNGWEFMEIPMPGYDFAAGGGTARKSGIIALSAPGGDSESLLNDQTQQPHKA